MAAADRKITYTAVEVAELIRPLTQSVEALQKENEELKRKLEHMNEILANAQRARFGQSSEKKTYVLSEDQMSLFNEAEIPFYPMEDGSDEPQIPECAQAYLADYICYRHLSNGNPVKQRQAQFYLNSFLRGMQRLRPQGMGSVTHRKHIYDVTDARYCR